MALIHRTLGDNEGGKNVPAARLEKAAVVDRQFGLARGCTRRSWRSLPPRVDSTTGSFASVFGGPRTAGFPRGRGAGRLLRYSSDSLAAFGRSGSVCSYNLDRNSRAVQRSLLGVGLTHVAHLVKSCRSRLCVPPTVNFPYSTLNSPQAESVEPTGRATSYRSSSGGTTVQPVVLTAMLVMIAIRASNARGANPGHQIAQVGLNKAPDPYLITAHACDHLGCDVAAWRSQMQSADLRVRRHSADALWEQGVARPCNASSVRFLLGFGICEC